jgi:hypothetical protein
LFIELKMSIGGSKVGILGVGSYGRRKGQKLAFKTKQTYNVISVNNKT